MTIQSKVPEPSVLEKTLASVAIGTSRVFITFTIGHPFDLVKTVMQANPVSNASGLKVSKGILLNKGLHGFYAGGIPNLMRTFLKETYRVPLRGYTKQYFVLKFPDFSGKKDVVNVLTGIIMATVDTFVICPLERVKVWMMTNKSANKELFSFFSSVPATSTLLAELFRGLRPLLARSMISWTSYLVVEDRIWLKAREFDIAVASESDELVFLAKLIVGGISGIINCGLTMPFDVVKTQAQKQGVTGASEGLIMMLNNVRLQHGWRGLYAGWQVQLPHYAIVGVLTSHVIHAVDKIWAR